MFTFENTKSEWIIVYLYKIIVGYLGKFLNIINNLAKYIFIKRTFYPLKYWVNKYLLSLLCARQVLDCENIAVTRQKSLPLWTLCFYILDHFYDIET